MNTRKKVRDALRKVVDPCSAATGSNLDIVEMGLVKSVEITGDHAEIEIRLTSPACHMVPYFIKEAETRVGSLPAIDSVDVAIDHGNEWTKDMMSEGAKERREEMLNRYKSQHPETIPE